jgi:cell shape-determining protein MreD
MKILFVLLFIASLFLEITITTIPLTFLLIFFLTLIYKNYWSFTVAFLAGILLDASSFRLLGLSSLFFVSFIFVVLLYQKKFEIFTLPFVLTGSFLGSFSYLLLTGHADSVFLESICGLIIGLVLFKLIQISKLKIET